MFLLLQWAAAAFLLIFLGITLKKLRKPRAMVTGLCLILCIASVLSGIVLAAVPMPAEEVSIEALGEKNPASSGSEVALRTVVVDGRETPVEASAEGSWFYSKDSKAYMWLDEADERLTSPLTKGIVLGISVGGGRNIQFISNERSGKVAVSYQGETKTYDLYGKEEGVKSVFIPDSNAFYDNTVKLLRLAGYGLMILCMVGLAFVLAEKLERETLLKLLCLGLSGLTALTFFLNFGITARSGKGVLALIADFNRSINAGNFLLSVLIIPMLYVFYRHCAKMYREGFSSVRGTLCIAVPSVIFALFMVVGSAFAKENTLRPLFANELQLLKALAGLIGYSAVFFFGITWLYHWLDRVELQKNLSKIRIKPVQLYLNSLGKRPFATSFITLLVAYIPYVLASYPAILMADSTRQISIAYGHFMLTNAHPVTHTLLLKFCMKVGDVLFHSSNAGIFFYAMLQFLMILAVISLLIRVLSEAGTASGILAVILLYFIFHPGVQNYMFLVTKDLINAAFMMLFLISIYRLFSGKKEIKTYLLIGISALGMILFRNDSVYILIISLLLMLFMMKGFRKQMIAILAGTVCFALCWNFLLTALDIPSHHEERNPKTTGVLVATMTQQTARYLRDAGDELTEEEREAISACFDMERMVKNYTPDDKADGAVGAMKADCSEEEWKQYQATWLKMFFKHPEIYLEATLNLKYDHLYPHTTGSYSYGWSTTQMNNLNNRLNYIPVEFSYPEQLSGWRQGYEALRKSFARVPILNIPFMTSSYLWVLLIWFSYCIYRKRKISIAIMLPALVLILVLIAGPTNARYFRYLYPYALCLPALIALGLTIEKRLPDQDGCVQREMSGQ